jgi:hypothetical protein
LIALLWAMLLNPLIVLVSAAIGFAVCRAAGINPHPPQMLIASGVCMFAAEMGMIPLLRQRNQSAAALFQAAFLGSVIHLALAAVLAVVVILGLKPGNSFVFWLLAMYWLTLASLCVLFVKTIRAQAGPMRTTSN